MRKKYNMGSALPEYVVPLLMFAVATLAVIPNGANLNTWFQQIMAQSTGGQMQGNTLNIKTGTLAWVPQPQTNAVNTTASQVPQAQTNAANAIPSQVSTMGKNNVSVTLQNGNVISLPAYASNAAALVETAGISGTTQYMVNLMKNLAQQLKATGSITEAQYNSLINLSNKGHDIGAVQGQLEDLMKNNGGTLVGLMDKTMPILGKASYAPGWFEYTVGSNVQALGSGQTNPWGEGGQTIEGLTGFNQNHPDAWANPMFANFVAAYKTAQSDGSLSDPAVKQIVNDLAFKILIGGEMMEENGSSNLTDKVKSIYTHYNSKGICSQGNGSDTGIKCS